MVKYKKILAFLLCFVLLFSVTACQKRTDVDEDEDYIYCLNGDWTGLVKVSFDIPDDGTAQEQAEAVLEELAAPSEEIEYSPAIPDGVSVQSCEISHTVATVDFSESYREIEPVTEKIVRAAVVQSLLRISDIRGVSFTVNGEMLTDSNGNPVGIMTEDDFVQNTVSALSSYETGTLTLYFANESGDQLVAQEVDVKYSTNMSKEKLIVEKLMKGPTKSGAYPTLNSDATLLNVSTKDGICYVNFDAEFLNSVYDVKPEIVIYSLVNSIIEGSEVSSVQITVNGEKNVTFASTVDLSSPLQENLSLVEE